MKWTLRAVVGTLLIVLGAFGLPVVVGEGIGELVVVAGIMFLGAFLVWWSAKSEKE